MELKEKIIDLINDKAYQPQNHNQIAESIDYHGDKSILLMALGELEREGKMAKTGKGKYVRPEMANLIVGILDMSEKGFGFVIPDNGGDHIFIPPPYLKGAMNRDRVFAKLKKSTRQGKTTEGEIERIISRANTKIVGTFTSSRNFGFVKPDDKRINKDVFIPKSEFGDAMTGQKVVVELNTWPENGRNAEGRIVEIIGNVGDPGVDIISIARAMGIDPEFPDDALKQAEKIPDVVLEEQIKKRKDLRDLRIVTIDGEDAKDLDDAVYIRKLDNGNYLLGVHIADVGYYVTEGSPLDVSAAERATSCYLVDRVIPMLPPKLSNGICSLNAGVDRLAFSVEMQINKSGEVVDHDMFKSVIKVTERMTYTNVTKILVDKDPEVMKRYENHLEDFRLMEELATILRAKRVARGSIDFDFPEVKIILNQKGKPIKIKPYEITVSNKIIEEFMLACNETVAERMFWLNAPFIYRIHEQPDSEKIETLNEFLKGIGYSIKGVSNLHPRSLQEVTEKIKGTDEERAVSTLMLRSLQQAKYSPKNEGHFGLAAKYYCHFTSPIRRYPDLFIHRVIDEMIENNFKMGDKRQAKLAVSADLNATISSERERLAEQAERDVEDMKKVEYMEDKVGESFEVIISSVVPFGFFVEMDNTIEGLVHMDTLMDDYYEFDPVRHYLIGERTKKVFKIGQKMTAKLVKADVETRRLDFIIEGLYFPGMNKKNITKIRY